VNAGQYQGLMALLGEIRDRMPEGKAPAASPVQCHHEDGERTRFTSESGEQAARRALAVMLQNLDGWIQGQRENHEALGHRHENRGEECWRSWAPDDIRRMVNDTARELGLAEFPMPTEPEEDRT
jgi:hypothetical protein